MSDRRRPSPWPPRCTRLSARNIDALVTSLMLPVMLMLLFVYLFGGAIETGTEYVTYVVPGVILLCAGFGSATTAVTVSQDMPSGIVDRFRSLDVGGPSILAGHVAASALRNAASTAIVFGVAFLIGFRPHAGALDWLAAIGVLAALRARHLVAGRGDRPDREVARGRQRLHLPDHVPALREQRVRPGRHDAVVDPGVRRCTSRSRR